MLQFCGCVHYTAHSHVPASLLLHNILLLSLVTLNLDMITLDVFFCFFIMFRLLRMFGLSFNYFFVCFSYIMYLVSLYYVFHNDSPSHDNTCNNSGQQLTTTTDNNYSRQQLTTTTHDNNLMTTLMTTLTTALNFHKHHHHQHAFG